ncbi:hypothetical protein [Bradyrhizobium canariense]|uniref:hypothetical protein n=1 Tax=Bradyrhizobium canariense TaxID=255045 RepID=UPI0011BAC0A0|nr:hypothetical protein [Bradyrhizobium canariense]
MGRFPVENGLLSLQQQNSVFLTRSTLAGPLGRSVASVVRNVRTGGTAGGDAKRKDIRVATNERSIFVLEIADAPAFAFEAESCSQAAEVARSPWFTRALDKFYLRRRESWDWNRPPLRLRVATTTEATVYRDFACEFADALDCFLVTHLSDQAVAATSERFDDRAASWDARKTRGPSTLE